MLRDYIPVIEYAGILQGVALVLFLALFVFILIWVFRQEDNEIHKMEMLPLQENDFETTLPGGKK